MAAIFSAPVSRSRSSRRQSGAALIVSLILLMVLTVLAVSTMRTASLELLMAGNAQFRENAFRLAQNGIDAVVRGNEPVGASDCPAAAPDPEAERRAGVRTRVRRDRATVRSADSVPHRAARNGRSHARTGPHPVRAEDRDRPRVA